MFQRLICPVHRTDAYCVTIAGDEMSSECAMILTYFRTVCDHVQMHLHPDIKRLQKLVCYPMSAMAVLANRHPYVTKNRTQCAQWIFAIVCYRRTEPAHSPTPLLPAIHACDSQLRPCPHRRALIAYQPMHVNKQRFVSLHSQKHVQVHQSLVDKSECLHINKTSLFPATLQLA